MRRFLRLFFKRKKRSLLKQFKTVKDSFKFSFLKYIFIPVLAFVVALATTLIMNLAAPPNNINDVPVPAPIKIYDKNNVLLFSAYTGRKYISYNEVPYLFIQSIQSQGDITLQLIKQHYLVNESSIVDKLQLAFFTLRIKMSLPEEKQIELYVNSLVYANSSIGVETASERYFGKRLSELSSKEILFIASLPIAPPYSIFSEVTNNNEDRIKDVSTSMVAHHEITEAQKNHILSEEIEANPIVGYKRDPAFVDVVLSKVLTQFDKEMLYKNGVIVKTNIDITQETNKIADAVAAHEDSLESNYQMQGNPIISITDIHGKQEYSISSLSMEGR